MLSRERLTEWANFYEKAASHVKSVYLPDAWRYPFFSADLRELNLDDARKIEWILTNGLGGYSSSTILGLNTRRSHGLLVSSSRSLKRSLLLSGLDEEVSFGGNTVQLWMHEHTPGINSPGKDFRGSFKHNLDSVSWDFDMDGITLKKRFEMIPNRNVLLVEYDVENKLDSDAVFSVKPLVSSRGVDELANEDIRFKSRFFSGRAVGVSSQAGYLMLYSELMDCSESQERWLRDVKYGAEGNSVESLHSPALFAITLEPGSKKVFKIIALGYSNEEEAVGVFKELALSRSGERRTKIVSSGMGGDLIAFTAYCDAFFADYLSNKTILAGYHLLGQRGRDAMISIPGLTLANRRFDIAEKVFDNFIEHMEDGRIPSGFRDGIPEYNDFDSTLWLIDALNEYGKCVGQDRLKKLLWAYWPNLKDSIKQYQKFENKGLLNVDSETWMGPLERKGAVELQGLWYNALKVMQYFGALLKDSVIVTNSIAKFEDNFMKTYWNGAYLSDSLSDKSMRPSQLIVISLDYHVVGPSEVSEILSQVKKELLTPVGLKSLSSEGSRYMGRCTESEDSKYNGAAWPWLIGPYFRAQIKSSKEKAKAEALDFVKNFLARHIREAGLGGISEVFDGDYPNAPRGCIMHAMNTAELMRTYSDAMKP